MANRLWLIGFICLFLVTSAYADSEFDAELTTMPKPAFTYTGYIDASYNYLLRSNRLISGKYNRLNDVEPNGLTLQQAAVTLSQVWEHGFGGLTNIVVGRDANLIAPAGWNTNVFGIQNIGLSIQQAYVQYQVNQLVVKAGEMLPLAGIETFDYTRDANFSLSILDGFAQPGVHVGLRGIQQVTPTLSLIAGTGNGWNTIRQVQQQHIIELGFNYNRPKQFIFMLDLYGGQEHLRDNIETGPTGNRYLLDMYATYYLTQQSQVAANYTYGMQTRAALPYNVIAQATWQGLAAYFNHAINDRWLASLRAEIFLDNNGYRSGVRQNWREITLTLGYKLLKHLEIMAETRHDFSNVNAILNNNGITAINNQQSYALNMLYDF